ncbi:hypothetical protein MLD38_008187 [Melastoma candidum]|uniref:Uncharacterized protein n=1 Tax=Melastoma candidum TaxID=119954 RepID=A0ACB9S215_9MYRT|nr:hypothetical protein MLD38_008187 [Melastoma candidum]
MDDVEELHDGGAVVGDGDGALVVVDELVHAAGAEGGADDVGDGGAGVDVADELRLPLGSISAFLEEYDLWLLFTIFSPKENVSHGNLGDGGCLLPS